MLQFSDNFQDNSAIHGFFLINIYFPRTPWREGARRQVAVCRLSPAPLAQHVPHQRPPGSCPRLCPPGGCSSAREQGAGSPPAATSPGPEGATRSPGWASVLFSVNTSPTFVFLSFAGSSTFSYKFSKSATMRFRKFTDSLSTLAWIAGETK